MTSDVCIVGLVEHLYGLFEDDDIRLSLDIPAIPLLRSSKPATVHSVERNVSTDRSGDLTKFYDTHTQTESNNLYYTVSQTSSSAVAERPRDASCHLIFR